MHFFSFNNLTSPFPTPKALVFLFVPIRTTDNHNLMLSSRLQIFPKWPPFHFHSSPPLPPLLFPTVFRTSFHPLPHLFFPILNHTFPQPARAEFDQAPSAADVVASTRSPTDDINRVKDLMALLLWLLLKEVHLLKCCSPHEKIALLGSSDELLYFNPEQISDNIRYFLHFFWNFWIKACTCELPRNHFISDHCSDHTGYSHRKALLPIPPFI